MEMVLIVVGAAIVIAALAAYLFIRAEKPMSYWIAERERIKALMLPND